jgi:hypothetical protein
VDDEACFVREGKNGIRWLRVPAVNDFILTNASRIPKGWDGVLPWEAVIATQLQGSVLTDKALKPFGLLAQAHKRVE